MKNRTPMILLLAGLSWSAAPAWGVESPHERLSRDCEVCHVATTFSRVEFTHGPTGFPLEGRHERLECVACHSLKDFSAVDVACRSCHEDVHRGKLGVDCAKCHSGEGWAVFDSEEIHARTSFPMLGRHNLLDCESCHSGLPVGDLALNTSRCVDCHLQDYLGTARPNHVAGGFATDCEECHFSTRWEPATMPDHDAAFFPIFSGTHRNAWDDCLVCHADPGNYQRFDCLSCHEHARTTMDGRHGGMSGYSYQSSSCYGCHPTGEAGRFGDHDAVFFPIYSGIHRNAWSDCVTCHTDPGNYQRFDCLGCHEHARTTMDGRHGAMSGYSYQSASCYGCHPTGEAGRFADHDAEFFPIYSGFHRNTWDDCVTCHVDPSNYVRFDCLSCHEHARTTMDGRHAGIGGYSYQSTACYECHPTGEAGQFGDHDAEFFPIFSGVHKGKWDDCATCHTNPATRADFTCFQCHEHDRTKMDDKHRGKRGYAYVPSACLECHPDGRK